MKLIRVMIHHNAKSVVSASYTPDFISLIDEFGTTRQPCGFLISVCREASMSNSLNMLKSLIFDKTVIVMFCESGN